MNIKRYINSAQLVETLNNLYLHRRFPFFLLKADLQQKKCEFIKLNDIHLVEEVLFNFFLFFLEFERVFLLQREQPQILL